ncbi:MAG: tetratricopeptide repeat protein [Acidobacteriia bacterium]|nr:tetratricopeptide repeat protein [Terriglobia bacterium]
MKGKTKTLTTITVTLAVAAISLLAQGSRTSEAQFKAAQHKEEVDGDLKGAIDQYKKLAQGSDRATAAKALVRIGYCYEKQGSVEARSAYARVVREFPDQIDAAQEAKGRIARLVSALETRNGVTFRQLPFTPVSGWIHTDGSHIAYLEPISGDIVVTDMNGGRKRVVTAGQEAGITRRVSSPVLSADGKNLAYRAFLDPEHTRSELAFRSIAGGEARSLLQIKPADSFQIQDFTPDGNQVVIVVFDRQAHAASLRLVSTVDGSVGTVRENKAGTIDSARVSADGRYVAFSEGTRDSGINLRIVAMRLDGGGENTVVEHSDANRPVVWLRSGGFLYTCNGTGDTALWLQPMSDGKPSGSPVSIRADLGHVEDLGAGPDGAVYLGRVIRDAETFLVDYDPVAGRTVGKPQPISSQRPGRHMAADWSGDGKQLVYLTPSMEHDPIENADVLTVRSVASGRESRILPQVATRNFISSYDGRSVLVEGIDDRERYGAFRVNTQTGESTPILIGDRRIGGIQPIWISQDEKTFYYRKWDEAAGQLTMMRRDLVEGGEQALLSTSISNHSCPTQHLLRVTAPIS